MMVHEGFGRHLYYLKQTPKQIPRATYWHIIWQPTFFLSVTMTRISICLLLLRIFGVNRAWRWALWVTVVLILAINTPSFIMVFTQCRPYAKSWNPLIDGYCWPADNNVKVALYSGIMAVIQDWFLATLPIAFIWNVQIKLKKKLGICALMGLGYFSGICAIVRTVISMQVFKAGGLADFSWVIIDLRIWGITENLVGIIAASIPTLKPLYVKTLGSNNFPWSKKSSSKGYHAHSDDVPMRKKILRPLGDPYSTTTLGTSTTTNGEPRACAFPAGKGYPGDACGDKVKIETEIELNDFDDRRPMAHQSEKQDPAYQV